MSYNEFWVRAFCAALPAYKTNLPREATWAAGLCADRALSEFKKRVARGDFEQ